MGQIRTVLGVLAGLAVAAASFGQFRGNWRDVGEPKISSDQLERYGEMLGLDEDQVVFAEDLLLGYMAEVSLIGERLNQVRDAAREEWRTTRDRTVWRDLMEVSGRFSEERDDLTDTLFDDLKLVLNDDQLGRWDEVERTFRRESTIDQGGVVPGETVDVVALVKRQDFAENDEAMGSVRPLLEQYSREMDRKLIQRNEAYEVGMREGTSAWFDQDMEKVSELYNRSRELAKEVRDINERYVRSIGGVLAEDDRAALEDAFKSEAFPAIYRDTTAHRALETALQIEDLSAEQTTQLEELRSRFADRIARINDSLAEAVNEWESERPASAVFNFRGGPESPDNIRDQRRARNEFIERMVEQVRGLLSEEQASVLPEVPGRDWRNMGASE